MAKTVAAAVESSAAASRTLDSCVMGAPESRSLVVAVGWDDAADGTLTADPFASARSEPFAERCSPTRSTSPGGDGTTPAAAVCHRSE